MSFPSNQTVLVDTGSGALFGPTTGRLQAGLAAAGVRAEEIDSVILWTHAHLDHFGGLLDAAGGPVFARAQHPAPASARRAPRAPGSAATCCCRGGVGPKREDIATWFDVLDLDDHVSFGGKA